MAPVSKRPSAVGRTILGWYDTVRPRDFPWRHTDDPFHTLVFEMLAHQTFARKIVPVYLALVDKYPTPEDMAEADVEEVEGIIRPLGFLYRAGRLKGIGQKLVDDFGGKVPEDEEGLLSLPGVGPYTAAAVLAFGFREPVAIVDTNVLRVYRRAFSTAVHSTKKGPDRATVEVVREALQSGRPRDYNYAVLDFAAVVCTHYNPKCASCPVLGFCDFGQERLRAGGSSGG